MFLGNPVEAPTPVTQGLFCICVIAIGFLDCSYLEFPSVVLIKRVQASRPTAMFPLPVTLLLDRVLGRRSQAEKSAASVGANSALTGSTVKAEFVFFSKYPRSFTFHLLGLLKKSLLWAKCLPFLLKSIRPKY